MSWIKRLWWRITGVDPGYSAYDAYVDQLDAARFASDLNTPESRAAITDLTRKD